MISRNISTRLLSIAQFFPAIVLTGCRQAGKTTLLREIFPDHNYVSLDIPSIAKLAENNPEDFFRKYNAPIIIDEVQYAPELFRNLKSVIDSNRQLVGQYILTGSQKFTLMQNVSESLAGRCAIIEMETLSLHEIQKHAPDTDIREIIIRGQFPELWRSQDLPTRTFYDSYLATYLERDARQIVNIPNLHQFESFIRILATQSAQTLNKSNLAKSVGVSAVTIQSWLSVLEASNQIALLQPWFMNFGKRIIKSPKVYFTDTGFLCHILGINKENFIDTPMLGHLWETFIYAELRKWQNTIEDAPNLWFYRDQRNREIDFLIEHGGKISLAECKWKQFPDKEDTKHMNPISNELNKSESPWKSGSQYIICNTPNAFPVTKDVTAISPFDITTQILQNA